MNKSVLLLVAVFLASFFTGIAIIDAADSLEIGNSERHNVVVILVNNLRTDHMPCNGYSRNTTPNMCEFGEENIRFTNTEAQSVWTLPSTSSLFLSQYPTVHGVDSHNRRIAQDATTLTETFRDKNYNTAAFVGNRKCQGGHLKSFYGYSQGFQKYNERGPWFNTSVPRAINWLENEQGESPFFLFVHGYDAHSPYGDVEANKSYTGSYDGILTDYVLDFGENDDEYILDNLRIENNTTVARLSNRTITLNQTDLEYIRARYDQDLAAADREIGRMLGYLKEKDMYEDTVVVLASNHGTMLGERGPGRKSWGHGFPYSEVTSSSMMIHVPGAESKEVERPVELIDLYPTLTDLTDISLPSSHGSRVQGESLADIIEHGKSTAETDYVFSEGTGASTFSVRNSEWKMVQTRDPDYEGEDQYFRNQAGKWIGIQREEVPEDVRDNLQLELNEWKTENRKLEGSSSIIRPTGSCNDDLLR